MTENLRPVFIGQMIASDVPDDVLVAYGLGSCVAICLYDPVARVGGMAHALLPTVRSGRVTEDTPSKFVDQGVPLLVHSLLKLGAKRFRLSACICGGAQMLSGASPNGQLNIGKHNVLAAEAALRAVNIRIRGHDTFGRFGRTVKLYLANGQITVRTLEQGERVLLAGIP